jgi:GT2 family glycosyltransferase
VKRLEIVVLNWNGLEDTRALLKSLRACRAPEGWSNAALVVDNGSSDGSVTALELEFPEVSVLALPENRRFAGGNNAGLKDALERGADAVMLLNNDTEADPGLCERLLLALEQDPSAGAAAPLIYFAPPSQEIWYAGGRCVPEFGVTAHRGLRTRDDGRFRSVERTGYLTGCCLLATRAAWERVGPLDERYYIYAEDADWCLRARAAGFKLLFVPTARLWHKVSSTTGAASYFKIYQRSRANLTLFSRHARGLGRLTWGPAYAVQQAALAAWLLASGKFEAARAVPQAIWDSARGRPAGEMEGR